MQEKLQAPNIDNENTARTSNGNLEFGDVFNTDPKSADFGRIQNDQVAMGVADRLQREFAADAIVRANMPKLVNSPRYKSPEERLDGFVIDEFTKHTGTDRVGAAFDYHLLQGEAKQTRESNRQS